MYRYRHSIPCSVHRHKLATVQCTSCAKLNASIEKSYHCSSKCFSDAWNKHKKYHHWAANAARNNSTGDQQDVKKLRSSDSWPNLIDGSVTAQNGLLHGNTVRRICLKRSLNMMQIYFLFRR